MKKFDVEQVMSDIRREIREKQLCANDLSYITYYHEKMLNQLREFGELVIFGAGDYGKLVLYDLKQHEINSVCCFCDNRVREGLIIEGLEVLKPQEAMERYPNACFIITPKNFENDIMSQLVHMGISIDNIKILNVENTGLIAL